MSEREIKIGDRFLANRCTLEVIDIDDDKPNYPYLVETILWDGNTYLQHFCKEELEQWALI